MNLAISNIAWPAAEEPAIAQLMQSMGITGVEVAPTKTWPKPLEVSDDDVRQYRRFWEQHGIQIVAMQALLYGRPDLTIFESAEKRQETLAYLTGIMRLAGTLGATALVFGSPKNRRVNDLPQTVIDEIALSFFQAAGEAARKYGVVLCLEPNPPQYGCDYINTTAQGLALVRQVNTAGFGLHLDAAAMTLNQEDIAQSLSSSAGQIHHFHASEPYLGPVGQGDVEHRLIATTLQQLGYPNWVSIEMRHNPEVETMGEIRRVLKFLQAVYGS